MTFQLRHLFLALVLHGLLFTLLAGGAQCSRKPPLPPVIQAVLLDPSRSETSAQQRKEEQRKKEDARRKAEEQKKRDEQEKRRQEIEDAARVKLEVETQRKKEETRKQQELSEKRKTEEATRRKREEDQRREKEQQKKREVETRQSMEQAMQQEALQRQVEQEQQARRKTEQAAAFEQWIGLVSDKVRRNWIRPPSAADTFKCLVRIQQLPGGQVINARIAQSCGNPALDESVIKAVLRSEPLPTVSDQALFQREFNFEFIP